MGFEVLLTMPRRHRQEGDHHPSTSTTPGTTSIAADLGISDSCLRGWMKQADLDEGRGGGGLTTAEREELVELRRELKVARLEVEILKRASAYFARENVLPK